MRSLLVVSCAATALCWQLAAAQASSPVSPEQKRPETVAANNGGLVALTDGAPVAQSAAASSSKTVAERRAETIEATKKGQLVPAGHGSPAPAR